MTYAGISRALAVLERFEKDLPKGWDTTENGQKQGFILIIALDSCVYRTDMSHGKGIYGIGKAAPLGVLLPFLMRNDPF